MCLFISSKDFKKKHLRQSGNIGNYVLKRKIWVIKFSSEEIFQSQLLVKFSGQFD